jgi:hypothetical protein
MPQAASVRKGGDRFVISSQGVCKPGDCRGMEADRTWSLKEKQ